jgi:hypothetical protein
LMCGKERHTSRGSPRSLARQKRVARDDNFNKESLALRREACQLVKEVYFPKRP